MSQRIYLPYKDAYFVLEEGDILLFRGTGFISALIKIAGEGEYSHVAIVSRHNGTWEAVEFREWYGGRTLDLQNYIIESTKNKVEIDVYRPSKWFLTLHYNKESGKVEFIKRKFNGKIITTCMRKLTGFPYSYKRIWLILKIKLFRWKILKDINKITNEIPTDEVVYPVCSTVLAYCFASKGYLILRNKNDQYMEPSDYSISPRCNYLFTITD
jgi:hypothetical protein